MEWTISDKDFIDVTTITEDQFIEKLKPKNIDSDNARLLYNKCINFVHDPYTIYSESSNQYGKEYKNLLCEWMNENGYSKRVGINPEILLSTWKWESGYGSYNCFGIRSGTNNSFDRQIDTCIVNYLNKYYFALYIKNVENKELISYYNDKNSGAWFNPCNAAMYSRCKYNTDTFIEWKRWHDTIANKKW